MGRRRAAPLTVGLCALILLAAASAVTPHFLLNVTASVEPGLYHLSRRVHLERGDLAVVTPGAGFGASLARHTGLPPGTPVIKPIAGLIGDRICRHGTVITVNGHAVAQALHRDAAGRLLPAWHGCIDIAPDQVFLLAPHPDSFDGRYVGVLPRSAVLGVAKRLRW